MSGTGFTTFTNCRYCLNGRLVDDHLVVSSDSGTILKRTGYIGGDIVDLDGAVIAPGFLELQTNGVNGFHFTHFDYPFQYEQKLAETARYYATQGVTGFWATIPTVAPHQFQKVSQVSHSAGRRDIIYGVAEMSLFRIHSLVRSWYPATSLKNE